jgi:hypothetical protein
VELGYKNTKKSLHAEFTAGHFDGNEIASLRAAAFQRTKAGDI